MADEPWGQTIVRRVIETERARERQKLGDPVAVRLGCNGNMMRMTLPPRSGVPRLGYQSNSSPPRHKRVEGRPVAGLRGHREIVAPPQLTNQRERFPGRGPLRDRDDIIDIRIALQDALAAAEHEDVQPALRESSPDSAHKRRGEQHVAESP